MTTIKEKLYFNFLRLSAFLGIFILVGTLILIFVSGRSVIDAQFITAMWSHQNIGEGGIMPAILGSLYLGLGVILISFPLGIGAAIYLTEYKTNSALRKIMRLTLRNLAGVPSVIYGLFGLVVFVQALSLGTSLMAAILTLSVMTLPWIITTSSEALQGVSQRLRESSLALGATQWQTIKHVVLPGALPGSLTGGIISISRAMGETAPIILVGATFYLTTLPSSVFDKFMALPYHIFILATQHSDPNAGAYASGAALILILLVFFLSLISIFARIYYRGKRTK